MRERMAAALTNYRRPEEEIPFDENADDFENANDGWADEEDEEEN